MKLLKDITPPIIWRLFSHTPPKTKGTTHGSENSIEIGQEQNADFYDNIFLEQNHWKQHYTLSEYYPLWTIIADRISRANINSILDIGCGPGQFACLLRDKGIQKYTGIDFSNERIKHAINVCPEFRFFHADVYKTDIFDTHDYGGVVCLEFLEHVEKDLEALERIKPGTKFYGTVPNFPFKAHVRHFITEEEVLQRYSPSFQELSVSSHLANPHGKVFF